MPARTPPIWCADLLVNVDPCAKGADSTPEGDRYSRVNEIWDAKAGTVRLAGAANEVLSFQLVVEKRAGGLESVRLEGDGALELALFANIPVPLRPLLTQRDRNRERKALFGGKVPSPLEGPFLDDPVVPLEAGRAGEYLAEVNRKAPRVPGRRRQTFTVELYIPKGTAPGGRELSLLVKAGGGELRLRVALTVYAFELPDEPACTADINNYGRAPASGFAGLDPASDRFLLVERGYFRMAREHRALFHLLPYSHSGRIESGYAPTLSGRGRRRRVADWEPFDRHWGGYLDGSAFEGCRFGARPAEYLYLPVNLNWPACFENFGAPGYDLEFKNVLGEMARHFSEKGWTRTRFEVFFNHKTRWKYYPWDMDEIRFERDNYATALLARMAIDAVKEHPEARFVNRIDSSWIFDKSARSELGDLVNLWVVNRGSHSESPDEVELLREKGQEVWFYGGPGGISAPDRLDTLRWPWAAWGRATDGFCWWNGLGWGRWEEVGRGGDHCFYPGARFGIEGPLASLRLKVLLRGMQDHAYLTLLERKTGSRAAADEIVGRTVGTGDREGWYQRGEGSEVGGADIQTASRTEKPWNTAPRSAWEAARAGTARAVEKA